MSLALPPARPAADDRAQPCARCGTASSRIAREPHWYAECGVADTVPGRFDAITLVLALVMLRMEREEALIAPSVRLTELFVDDMDGQLRQSGRRRSGGRQAHRQADGRAGRRLGALRDALPQGECGAGRSAANAMSRCGRRAIPA